VVDISLPGKPQQPTTNDQTFEPACVELQLGRNVIPFFKNPGLTIALFAFIWIKQISAATAKGKSNENISPREGWQR